jgi:hypothetical protein
MEIPSNVSATKLRNFLARNFNVRPIPSSPLSSNPYSSVQRLDGWCKPSDGLRLLKALESWGLNSSGYFKDDVCINVAVETDVHSFSTRKTRRLRRVSVYGPKKAKEITLPYYD